MKVESSFVDRDSVSKPIKGESNKAGPLVPVYNDLWQMFFTFVFFLPIVYFFFINPIYMIISYVVTPKILCPSGKGTASEVMFQDHPQCSLVAPTEWYIDEIRKQPQS